MELLGRTQTTTRCAQCAPADLPGHQQIPPSPEQSGSNGAAAKIGPKTWKRDYSLLLLLSVWKRYVSRQSNKRYHARERASQPSLSVAVYTRSCRTSAPVGQRGT